MQRQKVIHNCRQVFWADLEKKNQQILREHKYLTERVKKLELELKSEKELEKKFNQDINDLNQETQSLVEEIDKWQM